MPVMPASEKSKKADFSLQAFESLKIKEVVQIDHQKKISMSDSGYIQVLGMMDHFTKNAEAVPCITAAAGENCYNLIDSWTARHGCVATFQWDNATFFVSELTYNETFSSSPSSLYIVHTD